MTIAGIGFSGTGAEQRHGLRQAQGLEAAQPAGPEGEGRGRTGHEGLLADPQRHGVRLPAAGGDRAGQRHRVSTSSCWTGAGWATTKLMAARNQLLGMAAKDPRLVTGPAQRPGRRAPIPDRRGLGKGRRPGVPITSIHNTISTAFGSAYVNNFIQRRPGQAGVRPGRRPLPHAARRPGKTLRAQHRGEDGPLFRFCHRPLDLRFSQTGALQRVLFREYLGRTGAGQEFR